MVNKTNYDAEPGGPEPNSTPDRPGPTFRDPTSDVVPTNTELLTYLQSVSTPHFNQAIRPYSLDQLVADGTLIDDAYTKWVMTTLPAKKPSKKKNKKKTLIPDSNGTSNKQTLTEFCRILYKKPGDHYHGRKPPKGQT